MKMSTSASLVLLSILLSIAPSLSYRMNAALGPRRESTRNPVQLQNEASSAPSGMALCWEKTVSTSSDSTSINAEPEVQAFPDSSFLLTFRGDTSGIYSQGVYAQRFSLEGKKLGSEFRVNSFSRGGVQTHPRVTVLSTGRFAVTWISSQQSLSQAPNRADVYLQVFDLNGNPLTTDVRVSDNYHNWYIYSPDITALSNGDLIISWLEKQDPNVRGKAHLYVRRFDPLGFPVDTPRVVVMDAGLTQYPAALKDGGYAIAWQAWTGLPDQDEFHWLSIYGKVFDENSRELTANLALNIHQTGNQQNVSISALPSAGFVGTWAMHDFLNAREGIYGQVFTSSGQKVHTQDISLDSVLPDPANATSVCKDNPQVTALPDGNFATVWVVFDGTYNRTLRSCSGLNRYICLNAFTTAGAALPWTDEKSACFAADKTSSPISPYPAPHLAALPNGEIVVAYAKERRGIVLRKYSYTGCKTVHAGDDGTAWALIVVLTFLVGISFGAAMYHHHITFRLKHMPRSAPVDAHHVH